MYKHVVLAQEETYLIYIDRHLIHEVTSPQAFEGLKIHDRPLWRKESIVAVPDHNVPTSDRDEGNPRTLFTKIPSGDSRPELVKNITCF